ncbi:4Fe-4S single cluster domain-containing protein [Anaerolinea sp.]|uniref:4Fe-4S single cluster domain-containing protein n=1 Tax=Anaerolinea sp. TaxID=1872519 RepID=UPI002ACE01D1|nr:4Fe-4S single cluster domain-containing protein [Anaerolinea sp.]
MNAHKVPDLRIHAILPESVANGPGNRTVIWVQGCSLGCTGCFNPQTHSFHQGIRVNPLELAQEILSQQTPIEGITLTGGEPLFQIEALESLLSTLRANSSLSVILLTGFEWDEIFRLQGDRLFPYVDVIISGRFIKEKRLAQSFIGSANKEFHFLTTRYSLSDFQDVPVCEITISPEGNTFITGIDPLAW